MTEIQEFMNEWKNDATGIKSFFSEIFEYVSKLPNSVYTFKSRPGISYSLRFTRTELKKRPVFVLVDVIDDEPENRWLSICFFADMISPSDDADVVPHGLFDEDAMCFSVDEDNLEIKDDIMSKLLEAYNSSISL